MSSRPRRSQRPGSRQHRISGPTLHRNRPALIWPGNTPGACRWCLPVSGGVDGAARDRFVDVEVAVADLQVEAAVGIRADPGLVVNRGALAAEIRQRDKVASLALLALGKAGKVHYLNHP